MIAQLHSYVTTPIKFFDTSAKVFLICSVFFMPLGNAPTNIFMALTLMAWVIAGGYKERFQKISGNQLAWSALALFALICVGALYSTGEISDIKYQLLKYTKLLFLVVAISLLQDKKWRDWGMNAFALAMLITLTLSLASAVSPISFVKGTAHGAVGNHYVFKDHIAQNLIMSFFVILMLVRSQAQPTKLRQYIYLVIATCSIIDIIFFVQGRTGFISLAANTIIFVIFFTPKKNRKIWFSCVLLAGLALLYSSNNFTSRMKLAINEFKQQDKKELSSIGQRVEFTNKSLALIKESPVFGFGTGSYAKEFCRIAISEEWCQAGKFHPHNQFMAFGVQLGLLGIFVYGIFLWSAANLARQFPLPEKVIGLALVATLIVDSFLHAPLFLITEAQFFTLLLALTMSNTSLKEKIHDD